MLRSLLCCAALSMLLMGCERPEPDTINKPYPVTAHVPERIRTCPPIPKSYDYVSADPSEEAWQSEASAYVTVLHETATSCKANLGAVDTILDDHEAAVLAAQPPR